MLMADWETLSAKAKRFKINNKEMEEMEYGHWAVFLQSMSSPTILKVKSEDLIGYINTENSVGVNTCFSNPYNKYSYFKVIELDKNSDRILVKLMKTND